MDILSGWGLVVELASHSLDHWGHYLAGSDENRLADLNDAFRDPGVRAIFCTRGGKGSYRIAHALDFEAVRRNPKPLIGYSDITMLHLALWQRCRAIGFHGPHLAWHAEWYGAPAADSLYRAVMAPETVTIRQRSDDPTSRVVVDGRASGYLVGGNLGTIANAVGWVCPNFAGAILLIEAIDMAIGQIDKALTQLLRSGVLEGVRGVAVGEFIRCGEERSEKWSAPYVLQERLITLGVPVLGGLPIGHGQHPPTIPLGVNATIDTAAGTIVIDPGCE